MAKLTIIRGLPGSGKSTLAKTLGCLHLEADMYFVSKGVYTFDPARLKEAHAWCQQATRVALAAGMDVAVSNTFSQKWEAEPYLDMAKELGANVEIFNCRGEYGSVHSLPPEALERMKSRFENDLNWDLDGEYGVNFLN